MPFGVVFRVSQLNDSVLYAENVFQFPVVILRPEVLAVGGTDQLSGDANTLWHAPDAALQYIASPELLSDLPYIDGFPFVGKR